MAKKTQKPKKPKGEIVREGRLKFYAAEAFTVVASTPYGTFKLFKIVFARDGSIFLPFPYLDTKRGLLSEADPATEPDPKTINLRRNGIEVAYDVKFTHHTSGITHFTKLGEKGDVLLPQRRSYPLTGPIGKVFDFQLHWLRGFETVDGSKAQKDMQIALRFPHRHPSSIGVWGEWRRKKDILDNTDNPAGSVGPVTVMKRRADGAEGPVLFIGQPPGYPLRDHVLLIFAQEIPLPQGADRPTAIFMGGWDQHEGAAPQTAKMLVFMYPVADPAMDGQAAAE